jgi:hypothetical protein
LFLRLRPLVIGVLAEEVPRLKVKCAEDFFDVTSSEAF